MAEPVKNVFNATEIKRLAEAFHRHLESFNIQGFSEFILDGFDELALKQRSNRITEALHRFLPSDIEQGNQLVLQVLHPADITELSTTQSDDNGLRGWLVMPLADFVAQRNIPAQFLTGLQLLLPLTRRFSAEFAIRDFLLADFDKAMAVITPWLKHDSEHVRRLVSEGTRPRLPWGKQLPRVIANPEPLIPILTSLLDDSSEYVRRSVANNLNDIAKDHPEFVNDFIDKHIDKASRARHSLLKHAARTLFKSGNPRTLALFGFGPFDGAVYLSLARNRIAIGESLEMSLTVEQDGGAQTNLMIDYVVWHRKCNGKLSPKVFKCKQLMGFDGKTTVINKKHSFRPVTTRKYYGGTHKVQIVVNGKVMASCCFELLPG